MTMNIKNFLKKNSLAVLTVFVTLQLQAQTLKPDLQNLALWNLINRSAIPINEDGKKAVRINEMPGDGAMILKDTNFSNGTIEFDVKGKNVLQQSFVGFAFHVQDEKAYDAIYFRPFNFASPDTARRAHSVQYISSPDYGWEKLRETFPGKYENRINPVPDPDGWFHAKIVVDGRKISVFVNNASKPSLEVEKLTNTTKGGVALWVGNNSGGSFANLTISER